MSQPAETVWKQQLQRFDLLGWVFQKSYSLVSYIFFSSVSSFYHPVLKSVSLDGLWAPMLFKCVCKIGTLFELVRAQLFFLFRQNSCFSLSFIGSELFSTPTRKIYASVSDIRIWKVLQILRGPSPTRLLALNSPDYRRRTSKKALNFFFFLKKTFLHELGTVANFFPDFVEWMLLNFQKTTSVIEWNFKSTQKRRQFTTLLLRDQKEGLFLRK